MKAWSFSSMNMFYTCPRQYELTKVKNLIPYTETEATIWGSEVHTALENYMLGEPISDKYLQFKPYADKIIALPGDKFYERKFALTKNLTPTNFGADDAWVRGIIDVGVVNGDRAIALDWKTGKVRPDSDQLKLFAAFIFEHYPDVETVSTRYVWLKFNEVTKETYARSDLPGIWSHFMAKALRLEQAYANNKWVPKPSGLCAGWCGAGRSNCEHWSPRR